MRSRQFLISNCIWFLALGFALAGGAVGLSTAVFAQSVAPVKQQPSSGPAGVITPAAAPANQVADIGGAKEIHDPQKQCVKKSEFAVELKSGRNPVGDTIVFATNFLPTNQRVDVGVRSKFEKGARYFAAIDYGDGESYLLKRQDVVTRQAVEADTLVKKHLLEEGQTIVTLNMGDDFAWYWNRVDLYLYTCNSTTGQSPDQVSVASVRLSPYWLSLCVTAAAVVFLYVLAAFVLRKKDHTFISILRSLNPAKVTVGPDGKASLSTLQTLSFSLIVFGLILLLLLQTGMLTDLSGTILTLLGISGVGSTIAKGTDAQRNALAPDNRDWLLRRRWIPTAKPPVDPSNASWRDFFTTDGVFDVYRYQSFIFGLVVIGALVAAGVTQLSTFVIPDTILGIVGLSQLVYIGGKLAVSTNMSDLNTAISDLRDREKKLRDVVAAGAGQGVVADSQAALAAGVARPAYDAYKDKAKDVAALFTSVTGIDVSDAALEPALN